MPAIKSHQVSSQILPYGFIIMAKMEGNRMHMLMKHDKRKTPESVDHIIICDPCVHRSSFVLLLLTAASGFYLICINSHLDFNINISIMIQWS